jgi:hypothetical protein
MSKFDYARGIITYLFAIVTIGIAVAIVLATLTADNISFAVKYEKAKEVFALLLGVFGTILGFYFASETTRGAGDVLQLSSLDMTPQPVAANGVVTLRGVVRGGTPPYRFGVAQGKAPAETTDFAGDGGWIIKQVQVRAPALGESHSLFVLVEDVNKRQAQQAAPIKLDEPKTGEPKTGEPKTGGPKTGEPKAGKPKPGAPSR